MALFKEILIVAAKSAIFTAVVYLERKDAIAEYIKQQQKQQ